jgi:SAM-dependent methyltransferase
MHKKTWWSKFYDNLLAEMLLKRIDDKEAEVSTQAIARLLHLPIGGIVYDQCCGIGSLSLPLAKRGYIVHAADQAYGYIKQAQLAAQKAGLNINYAAADANTWIPPDPCHGVFNWWTSFGYGLNDDENRLMIDRAVEALLPGGYYLIDFMNMPQVLQNFQRDVVIERETEIGNVILWRRSFYDDNQKMMDKIWTYLLPDGERVVHKSRVRCYTPAELQALLAQCGLKNITCFGDEDGTPLSKTSPRCICRGRKLT